MLVKSIPGPVSNTAQLDYECVYASVYNNFGADIPAGAQVCFDPAASATQYLGRAVTRPATANLPFYAGCAVFGILNGMWGLVVAYGICQGFLDGGTTDVNLGSSVIPTNGSFYANAPAAVTVGTGAWITAFASQTNTSVTGLIMIRSM